MLDTGLRVPLATAGFRRQGFHPFAVEGDHVYVWCEGHDRYRGWRPHAEVELWTEPAAEAARRLRAAVAVRVEDDSRSAPIATTGAQMPKLICDITMSLDGFITGPNPSVEQPLLDEVQVHVAPLLLGEGTRLFGHLGADPVDLEITRVVESPAVTHLRYRVLG